jgi:DNA-binding winged helix-turn-helix (wHTH) protein/tetratricopeptide (TPR) repeat protein
MAAPRVYEFGHYRLDLATCRLLRDGEAVSLTPKAFDTLLALIERRDRVVDKTELMQVVWPDSFVEEANLSQTIFVLRKALGVDANGRHFIDTIPRRGYRFAADVRQVDIDGGTGAPNITSTPADASPAAEATSRVLESERKPATVLHCSLANPAAVIERLGPARMHEVMRKLFALAADEIGRYEGVISQRHTDGFVAVFGASAVHEDDARRTILAALALQTGFRHVTPADAADEEDLHLQMGVNTGPLVIGRLADDRHIEYTAVGETMRTASLLQQLAQPGAILISEASWRAVRRYASADPVAVPLPEGARAYRVTGLLRQVPVAPPPTSLAPFVGRQQEVAVLDALLAQALAGKGQVVSVVGEPGIGKSRLLDEFTRPLAGRPDSPTVLEGRCVSYGSSIPYVPLAHLVRAHCGVDEADPPETIRAAIDGLVGNNGLPSDGRACLLRLIGVVDDTTALEHLSPEAVKFRTFNVLRLLFLKAAARRPLVVVLEDVHWIDRTSEEFVATLVERLGAARVVLVATYRPGYRAPWMDRSYVTQIPLSPLTSADSARLVESVAREQPLGAEVSTEILSRGEGNPFFLEELTRTVIEHGAGTEAIPATVHGVIMARVDRLADVAKHLLQTASVLGRDVPLGLLSRVWRGPANFDAELVELCRLEFLYERPAGDEPTYVFKHALTQDVAYDSLLARTRRDLHLRAARALEELYADRLDDSAATLAYHYARTDLIDEAVVWLTRAADHAARVYANAEAILHLDLAARRLQRLPEGPDRDRRMLEVALRHAQSLYFLGRFRESVDVLLPHEARLARLKDPALAAAYSFWLAHMYSRLGDQRRAADNARVAIEAATASGDEATLGKAHGLLALEAHWTGRPQEGLAHGAEAIRLLESRADQGWWLGMAHFYMAMNNLFQGQFDAALVKAADADAVGRALGDPRLPTYAGFIVGLTQASRANHDAAIAACRRSLEEAPDRVSRAYASLFLGWALLEKGDHEEARARLQPMVAELESFAFPQWHALAATLTAESLRLAGRLEEASSFVERGLQVATRAAYWFAVAFSHRVAGRIARDRGTAQEARSAFQQALDVFLRIESAFEAARTRLDLAQLAIAVGEVECARDELTAAARTFEAFDVPEYRERTARLAATVGMGRF